MGRRRRSHIPRRRPRPGLEVPQLHRRPADLVAADAVYRRRLLGVVRRGRLAQLVEALERARAGRRVPAALGARHEEAAGHQDEVPRPGGVAAGAPVAGPHKDGEAAGGEDGEQRDDDPEQRLRGHVLGAVGGCGHGGRLGRGGCIHLSGLNAHARSLMAVRSSRARFASRRDGPEALGLATPSRMNICPLETMSPRGHHHHPDKIAVMDKQGPGRHPREVASSTGIRPFSISRATGYTLVLQPPPPGQPVAAVSRPRPPPLWPNHKSMASYGGGVGPPSLLAAAPAAADPERALSPPHEGCRVIARPRVFGSRMESETHRMRHGRKGDQPLPVSGPWSNGRVLLRNCQNRAAYGLEDCWLSSTAGLFQLCRRPTILTNAGSS